MAFSSLIMFFNLVLHAPQAYFTFAEQIFHIEDISLVPTERISLKKARMSVLFSWCGRPDLNRYGVTTEGF